MRKLYIFTMRLLGRHVLARDCWCQPCVIDYRAIDEALGRDFDYRFRNQI